MDEVHAHYIGLLKYMVLKINITKSKSFPKTIQLNNGFSFTINIIN